MALTLFNAGIFSIFCTLQVCFFMSIRRRNLLIFTTAVEILVTYGYLCSETVLQRSIVSVVGIALAGGLSFFCYEGGTYCKANYLMMQAFVSSLIFFVSEQVSEPFQEWRQIGIFCFSVLLQVAWFHFLYFMRLNGYITLYYSEETYKRVCYIMELGYIPLLVTASGVLNPFIKDTYVFLILAISFAVFLGMALHTLVMSKKELITSNKLDSVVVQQGLVRKYIDNLQSMQQQIRIMNHDQKHYLSTMENLLETGQYKRAKEYLKSQKEHNSVFNSQIIFCEDNLINAILADAYSKASSLGVTLDSEIRISDKILVDDVALSALLLNSLTNAVESFKTSPSIEDRWIRVKLYTANGHMVYHISNTVGRDIYIVNNKIASTKSKDGEEHGVGLESIRSVVDSYQGQLEITAENHIFSLRAILVNMRI
ncbi:sensor histidine kinase [Extibacter muris]|uniref:sensor histidine kinase n=1 Tax=Extibacter muris TaxID=1796622 RepID=UPI001D064E3F|nr:GHKL domain-containing protein [Extibacter muris]MCB6202539.1 GHKL domain-containing protein [Extibacter muris]MCQ4664408.1 GHKL domain-containing protein [Extibacter muris]MCQ4693617.1 GHKL domain-containing protein [Extibacter muris]